MSSVSSPLNLSRSSSSASEDGVTEGVVDDEAINWPVSWDGGFRPGRPRLGRLNDWRQKSCHWIGRVEGSLSANGLICHSCDMESWMGFSVNAGAFLIAPGWENAYPWTESSLYLGCSFGLFLESWLCEENSFCQPGSAHDVGSFPP